MLYNFSKYTDAELKIMVSEAFNTIEKTGFIDNNTLLSKAWNEVQALRPYYFLASISTFLEELYIQFAKRFNLYRSYREYLRAAVIGIDCKECEEKQKIN